MIFFILISYGSLWGQENNCVTALNLSQPNSAGLCEEFSESHFGFEIGRGTPYPSVTSLGTNVLSGHVFVKGNFLIDEPFTFLDCIVKINPGVGITIQSPVQTTINNKLTIKNSQLFACEEMWNGITMSTNTSIATDNSKIEDAITAISADKINYSVILVRGTQFNKNLKGISVINKLRDDEMGTLILTCSNNKFLCKRPLNGTVNERSENGIYLENADLLSLKDCEFRNQNYGIYSSLHNNMINCKKTVFHHNYQYDIYADKGNIFIDEESEFKHFGEGSILIEEVNELNIKNSSFITVDNIWSGPKSVIEILKFGFNSNTFLFNNEFNFNVPPEGRIRAIHLKGGNVSAGTKIDISTNQFYCDSDGDYSIFLDGSFPSSSTTNIIFNVFETGAPNALFSDIRSNGDKNNLSITGNTFSPTINSRNKTAISISSSEGTNNKINSNTFLPNEENDTRAVRSVSLTNGDNFNICTNFILNGVNSAFRFSGINILTNLSTNEIVGTASGVEIAENAFIGEQINNENEWWPIESGGIPIWAENDCINCSFQQAQDNKFDVHKPQSTTSPSGNAFTEFHPTTISIDPDDSDQWFEFETGNTPNGEYCFDRSPLNSNTFARISADQFDFSEYNSPAMEPRMQLFLFNQVINNPEDFNTISDFSSFVSNMENSNLFNIYNIKKNIEMALGNGEDYDNFELLKSQSLTYRNSLLSYIESLNDLDALNLSNIQPYLDDAHLERNQINEDFDNLVLNALNLRNQKLLQELSILNSFIGANEFERSFKEYYSIYIENLIHGTIDDGSIEILENLASKCTTEAGVYPANAYSMLPDCLQEEVITCNNYFGDENSAIPSERLENFINKVDKTEILNIYPNPTSSQINISFNKRITSLESISLYNTLGKTVLYKELESESQFLTLEPNLKPGLYLLYIRYDTNQISTEKVWIK